jgi:deoxyribodipyrimidine photo-lyase
MKGDLLVPALRISTINDSPIRTDGEFVLYWMTAFRRPTWNFSLQRAVEWAQQLGKPLVILEALRVAYPWASDRIHQFILEGIADNLAWFQDKPVTYYPYIETDPSLGSGLFSSLAKSAAVIVTDDFPCFFLPRMVHAAASKTDVRMEKVDANGLLPMRAADRVFARAFDFRRFLQRQLQPHLEQTPQPDPLFHVQIAKPIPISAAILKRWPKATSKQLQQIPSLIASLPIDHTVFPGSIRGGFAAGLAAMKNFVAKKLDRYTFDRSEPSLEGTSGLSAYLHFGHISVHQVLAEIAAAEEWSPQQIGKTRSGQREGWWQLSPAAESYLDELVTWREIGLNLCWQTEDYDKYNSLPDWAQQTLEKHARDPRPHLYTPAQLENADTHDLLWNAAQNQLRQEGRMHNYLRMLWGKKILEWSKQPQESLETMIHLNNKYALDGRNPNSYSGIFWVLGRYDRAWGPERPIFGTIRYMSSDNTARKFNVKPFIARYAP